MSPVSLFFVNTSLCREWVISQAPIPESNPDFPLPVTTMVGAEPTIVDKADI